ncbi:MAG: hypothetical protein K2O82_00185, partial [Alistipes sp.]|nr:hypothetical protein [Alistipes sp.]
MDIFGLQKQNSARKKFHKYPNEKIPENSDCPIRNIYRSLQLQQWNFGHALLLIVNVCVCKISRKIREILALHTPPNRELKGACEKYLGLLSSSIARLGFPAFGFWILLGRYFSSAYFSSNNFDVLIFRF